MIFKVETDAGWTWIDGIERVQTFGYLRNGRDGAEQAGMEMNFGTLDELMTAVAATWGDPAERSFEFESWPHLEGPPRMVMSMVLTRKNHEAVLALVASPAFLLSEKGDTIERLAY